MGGKEGMWEEEVLLGVTGELEVRSRETEARWEMEEELQEDEAVQEMLGGAAASGTTTEELKVKVEVGVQLTPEELQAVEIGVQFYEKLEDVNSWHDATSSNSRLPSPAPTTAFSLYRPLAPSPDAALPSPTSATLAAPSHRPSPSSLTRSNLSAHSFFASLEDALPPLPRAASLTGSTLSSLPSSSFSSAHSSLPSSSPLSLLSPLSASLQIFHTTLLTTFLLPSLLHRFMPLEL